MLHQRRLLVAAGKLGLCKAVCHRHVGAVDKLRLLVKSVAKALIYAVDLALDIGKIRGQHVAVYDTAGIASVVAPAVSAPAEEEKNDNPDPVFAPHTHATAVAVRGRDRHSHHGSTVGKRHIISPFINFIYQIVATIRSME